MSTPAIERSDLEPILRSHQGNEVFRQTLERVASSDDLLRILGRYIYFNSCFGGGVANLSGEIAVRQDLFRDPDETVEIIADRSIEVAADIFFAAIDEFDDRATTHRDTHRTLAQSTLKAAGTYFRYSPDDLNEVLSVNTATSDAMARVRDGYGLNQTVDATKLFQSIGFHLSSEILADEEFRVLDGFLRSSYPDLVKYLENTEVKMGAHKHAAYYWVHIHTSVEADHFGAAVVGANRAIRYYAGPEPADTLKVWILQGFREFGDVQAEFMRGLLE